MPDERAEPLMEGGFSILARPGVYTYGTDAVLLAGFCGPMRRERVCDLGAGTGILSLLLCARHPGVTVDGVEIDMEAAELMRRSVRLNGLEERVRVFCGDARETGLLPDNHAYDAVVCNPPYHEKRPEQMKNGGARREETLEYGEAAACAARLLRAKGKLFTMCPARRMFEMSFAMRSAGFSVKRMQLVQSLPGKAPYLCLLEGRLNAREGADVLRAMVLNAPKEEE